MYTHKELASVIAESFGYRMGPGPHPVATWGPNAMPKLKRGQHMPRIEAWGAMTRVYGPDWYVDLYAWQEPEGLNPNVVGITGNIEEADKAMQPVLPSLPATMAAAYRSRMAWLRANPEYVRSAVKQTEQKARVSPSQTVV